jgi:hypothetical protein
VKTTPDLAPLTLFDPDGNPVRLGDLIDRPTIVKVLRYYGCPPCRAYLDDLTVAHDRITGLGGGVLGVAAHAAHQARHRVSAGIPFPLLLDPEHLVAARLGLGLGRQTLRHFLFDGASWRRWLRSLRRARQGLITGGWWEQPAVAVTDSAGRVAWVHRGEGIGDDPPLAGVFRHLEAIAAAE